MQNLPTVENPQGDESAMHLSSSKTHALKAADDLVAAGTSKIQQITDAATKQSRQYVDVAQDRVSTWAKSASGFTRSNPIRAIITALSVGFVLGAIFRRSFIAGSCE